ncbi:BTAD domain-containing putative transcriptional regulator [Amycolatopsis sp. NPDC057786]|uniref:BTAD domain-containing putative transcriptional regulator n=1 Tax=Amycolatopsis sp. NPDC057786 TaxID=3346250 RepID=UPI0036728F6B
MTSPAAQRVRGVLAALALLAFVAGIPNGLLVLGADPARLIPDRWPDPVPIDRWPEQIWATLRWAWITGDLMIWLVVAVAWAGWLALTLSVIVEVIRQTGHGVRTARGLLRRVPRGRWIAGLVAAVLVATSTGTAGASTASATPAAATAPPWPHEHPVAAARGSATDQPTGTVGAATTPVLAAARTYDAVPYTVVHGDTLWDLAERHLGRGTRYHEIVRLNPALLADSPGDLEPGWTLLFPPDAIALHRPAGITTASGRTVPVEPTDTLSAIAERELGDPDAWPAIFDLNAGHTQPDGRALRHPDQILPGWHLILPAQVAPPPEQPATPPSSPTPAPAPEGPATSAEEPASPDAPRGEQPALPEAQPGTGIALPTGAFVGLGLAALITVAMITVRLRRRRWYHPGVRDEADPAGLPVVRALRIAHDTATSTPADDDNPTAAPTSPGHARPADIHIRDRARATVRAVLPASQNTALGVRDGHAIALDLASTRGLGLTGPGAHAAARALIMTLLAQATNDGLDAMIVMPADDARALFGHDLADPVPDRLLIVDDLPAALATLEAELVARTDTSDVARDDPPANRAHPRGDIGPAVVVATPTADRNRRAHAVLDNGAHLGLAGVFLGPWRPGGTVRVRDDGTVEATSPTLSEDLADARLFTLPDADARDLLALLHAAEPGSDDPIRDFTLACSAVEPGTQRQSRAESTTASVEPLVFEYEFATAPDAAAVAPPTETASDNRGENPTTGPSGPAESETTEPSPPEASNHPRPSAAQRDDDQTTAPRPATDPAPVPPLHLQVLGRLHLTRVTPEPRDLIAVLAPRQREILVYLALHRDGRRRETLSAALWPEAPGERPYNSFHATLSQLRRSLRQASNDDTFDIIVNQDSHYRLDQTILTADLWRLQDAITASRRTSATEAVEASNRVTELYRGDLAEGITADWIDGPREALRRDVLDTLSTLIRKLRTDNPEQALALLEQARRLDPYNEAIYRDLMRLQARLDQHDSIPRTLHLLTTSLAELNQRPARSTLSLADALQQPRKNISNRQAS